MKRPNEIEIIVLFAILHVVVSLTARLIGFNDELALTLLTMLMSVMLSMRKQMNVVFMILAVVLVNILGVYLGKVFGDIVRKIVLPGNPIQHYIRGPISTFLTTLVIGAIQLAVSNLIRKLPFYRDGDTNNVVWLLFAFIAILAIRLALMMQTFSNSSPKNIALNIVIDYVCSFVAVLWMASYTLRAQHDIKMEKQKRHEAQYSYQILKQQIEPHFLFNSLNSLDSIVNAGDNAQASKFIHKLSGIYRYLIENENEHLVYLGDELRFVKQYIDLMKIRFPVGLETIIDIDKDEICYFVIPCALQLLVENATKHNSISAESPLKIRISIDNGYVQVVNNRNPKFSSQPSTGNGQRYIRQRYRDEVGKEIIVIQEEQAYTVKLPLL